MVDEEPASLNWEVADSLLSANFPFRTLPSRQGARGYRMTSNGQELRARSQGGEVVLLGLPFIDSVLQPATGVQDRLPGEHWYVVRARADLEHAISAVLQAAVLSPRIIEPEPASDVRAGVQIEANRMSPQATNTILYGPPGTGKTYTTVGRAVRLCDGALPADGSRAAVMARYEVLRREGRVHFITFHQSYGYEEFIEGLRPQENAGGHPSYVVVPGAFRRACESARLRNRVTPGLSRRPLRERTVFKMSLGVRSTGEGTEVFNYCLENDCVLAGWAGDLDFTGCDDEAAVRLKVGAGMHELQKAGRQTQYVNDFMHTAKVGDLIVVSHGNKAFRGIAEVTGEYEYLEDGPFRQARAVNWLAVFKTGHPASNVCAQDFNSAHFYKLAATDINYESLQALVVPQHDVGADKPHVLIIDEINRANISKVFGELITLLEPDKRDGMANAITLRLPYSGDDFSVPANLHVLGTMNTADRSIALLDTALRRRFDFEELMPLPSQLAGRMVESIDIEKLLEALNERVESLYDRDHTIGHAFFINVNSLEDLHQAFRRKVLPLLLEYFHDRWSDVRRVLNDLGDGDFLQRRTLALVATDGDDTYSDEPRVAYAVNAVAFPVAAYKRIYSAG